MSRGRFTSLIVVGCLGVLAARPAVACGLCDEDKVAATYDEAVVRRAAALRHPLLFAALEGPVAGGTRELADRIRSAVAKAPGVDPGTVRISLDPPAISCAWNPSAGSRAGIVAAADRALTRSRVRLRPIDQVRLPAARTELTRAARASRR